MLDACWVSFPRHCCGVERPQQLQCATVSVQGGAVCDQSDQFHLHAPMPEPKQGYVVTSTRTPVTC
jgi:hypothetical protein